MWSCSYKLPILFEIKLRNSHGCVTNNSFCYISRKHDEKENTYVTFCETVIINVRE